MSGRFKLYVLTILARLIVASLLGPPFAFARKLSTACNIFQEKKAAKITVRGMDLWMGSVKIRAQVTLDDHSYMEYPMIIGMRTLTQGDFLIDVAPCGS